MEQIRRLIYNERGIAIVVATVESNYFIVSINCSPARHAFRMLIINERDNASRPSPLACTPLPIPSLSQSRSQVTAQIFQCCFWTNFEFSTATIDFNHPQYLIHLNTNRINTISVSIDLGILERFRRIYYHPKNFESIILPEETKKERKKGTKALNSLLGKIRNPTAKEDPT